MTQIGVWGSAKACALRVARLGTDCAPVVGATNGVATSAIIRLAATANVEAGEVYQLKNGCGSIAVRSRESDKLTDMGLTLDLATRDFELIELLTGATLLLNAATPVKNIGIARRGVGATNPSFVSLEVWTQSIDDGGVCAVGGVNPGWFRVIYPRATFTLGDTTVENGVATVSLTGFGTQNPQWGNGPWNDYPATGTLPTTVAEAIILDAAGPPVLQNGYIAVPAQT